VGALEAFLIGGLVGGGGGLVVWLVWASSAKGRSATSFAVTNWSPAQVLAVAQSYFIANGMRIHATEDGLVGEEGSEWAAGARVLEVRARGRDGGADVRIDAYIRSLYPKEISADPKAFFGMVPRRKLLGLAQGLAASLGTPGAVWEHRRT